MGVGICLMHYVGMSGYHTDGVIHWSRSYVLASVGVGAAFSAGALWVAGPGSSKARQAAAAFLLTSAIISMHFIGMAAVTIWFGAAYSGREVHATPCQPPKTCLRHKL